MNRYIEIGPTPSDEDCQQVGMPGYDHALARAECQRFITQLRAQFGNEPQGARLMVQSTRHDYGQCLEVVVQVEDDNEQAMQYALRCEGDAWPKWQS